MKKLSIAALMLLSATAANAASTVLYDNETMLNLDQMIPMVVRGETTLYKSYTISGDTENILIDNKTFTIRDTHTACANSSNWPYIATGWGMELSVDGESIGTICARTRLWGSLFGVYSKFTLTERAGKNVVTYQDNGSSYISGDYPASMKSVSYSW